MRTWRDELIRVEPEIYKLIARLKDYDPEGQLVRWDFARGTRQGKTEADAEFILTQCLPILRGEK